MILFMSSESARWIPDGQLCPTVPNRSNYIHWIQDLVSSDIIPKNNTNEKIVRGFDIGTGTNCIYPLLGASLLGWSFVGSDVTDIAVDWAERNVKSNPHVAELIEIRRVQCCHGTLSVEGSHCRESGNGESKVDKSGSVTDEAKPSPSPSFTLKTDLNRNYSGPPVLLGVVRDGEKFDFCMCNPPFFDSMEEAGLNPKTSCGGTPEEMVCPGGENAFISRIIEDSVVLKETFRWYTSMVGRKIILKFLTSKLREMGVTVVKTTEFVQGQTCRWGLAWSFVPPARKIVFPHATEKSNLSFTLEGLQRQFGAIHVLQSIESFFRTFGASCVMNTCLFTVNITASYDQCNAVLKNEATYLKEDASFNTMENISCGSSPHFSLNSLSFQISVFQQIPGTLLVKASLQLRDSTVSGMFSLMVQQLEEILRHKFCKSKAGSN
uniref:U6 small nuclear RNA (adenine-(43)-N(6))-methyltransferase n=1 Tax=Rhizophora mucronata TaxID=61149 RepID=A0A2P2JCF8_RHIMU